MWKDVVFAESMLPILVSSHCGFVTNVLGILISTVVLSVVILSPAIAMSASSRDQRPLQPRKKPRPSVPLFHQSDAPPGRASRNAFASYSDAVLADGKAEAETFNIWEAEECGLCNGKVDKAY